MSDDSVEPVPAAGRRRRPTRRSYRTWVPLVAVICLTAVVASSVPVAAAEKGTFSLKPQHGKSTTISGSMLNGVASVYFTVPKITGGNAYLAVAMRASGTSKAYRARVTIRPSGSMLVGFSRVSGDEEQVLVSTPIAAKVKSGQRIRLQGAVSDTSPVRLWVRAWVAGTNTPDWQSQLDDSSTSRITSTGKVGAWGYLSREASKKVAVKFSGLKFKTYARYPVPVVDAAPKPSAVEPTPTPSPGVTAPQTSITSGPAENSFQDSTSASLGFSSSVSNSRFECSLDNSSFTTCGSPTTYNGLSAAAHTFKVRAIAAGLTDPTPAVRTFSVNAAEPPSKDGKPSAATTGVPEGTKLTRRDGDIVITKDGTKLDKLDIHGFVTVRADNVQITNSIVRGGVAKNNTGLITNYGSKKLLIENVDLKADHPSVWIDGIKGWNFVARRVHVVGNVDSVKIHGDNVTVEDSLLENTTYFASDPNQGGGPTHNDNIQIQQGKDIRIVDNTIRGATNFAILGAASIGDTPNLVVDGNWLDGGHCTVKLEAFKGYSQKSTVRNNKFGPNRQIQSCVFQATPTVNLAASGNVYENNGGAVPILRK